MNETCLFELGENRRITWEITHKCNYNCRHCCSKAGAKYEKELEKKRIFSVIDEMNSEKVDSIYFSGGEPLIRNDIIEILNKAKSIQNIKLSLASNGSLITERMAKDLKDSGLNCVLISLDGNTAEVQNEIRQNCNAFQDAFVSEWFLSGSEHLHHIGIISRRDNLFDT